MKTNERIPPLSADRIINSFWSLQKSSTEREDIEQGLASKRINQPVYFSLLEQRHYDKYWLEELFNVHLALRITPKISHDDIRI